MNFEIVWRRLSFILLVCAFVSGTALSQSWNPNHSIGTITGNYNFSINQQVDLLVEINVATFAHIGCSYQWEQSIRPTTGFIPIDQADNGSYLPGVFTHTIYYRRKTTDISGNYIYSNVVKIQLVGKNWEDINYLREHTITTTGITDRQSVDQLPIGQKSETTTYLDGLGRSIEKLNRETATPAQGNSQWGDAVQFSHYDETGKEVKKFLPYTTNAQPGKFKTSPLTDQTQYYANTYNETNAFSTLSFDNSPLNRVVNIKETGLIWTAGIGKSAAYDMNSAEDNVQVFYADYVIGDPPVHDGAYAPNTLFKLIYTDENGRQVIEYTNKAGQIILRKVQIDDNPTTGHTGWICTYSVYDDFGLLRFQLQPEAVKYLEANNWSFAGANGLQVLNELCFQYGYDEKGRAIWKKSPGAAPLNMIYDLRDRLVFTQDGNQALKSPAEWTTSLYDELDRPVITTLYRTNKSLSNLQTDIAASASNSSVTISNPGQPLTDLLVDNRNLAIPRYAAQNSIQFTAVSGTAFESGINDLFVAEIDASATTPPFAVSSVVYKNPISASDLNNPGVTTILKYLFYDNYSFPGVNSFDNSYTNLAAYNSSNPNVQSITASLRTISLPTGSKTRVLGTNLFLNGTVYYDDKGRALQNLESNIKSGIDISTFQYHFDGRVLSTCSNHSAPGTSYQQYTTLTKYIFDKIGRVTAVQKQWGSNGFKTISSYDYDDVGRIKTKHLDPGYTGNGSNELESLNYTFNIHNQLTGINKDYALKNPAGYDKWGHFFGMYLGFDNKDNVFSKRQLNGQITGQLWTTQGDEAQRKYDYDYDNAGRLIKAAFTEQQHGGDCWSNNKMDFTVSGSSGKITYDLNGNLLTMLQKGVTPGNAAPITIDDLHYSYPAYSNKLQSVTDLMAMTNVNGLSGDFKDGTNGAGTPDYVYDANGNVVTDLNKNVKDLGNVAGANGISYNYLDKPDQIRIAGKGLIKIVYSADGEKLQRIFTPETGIATTTTYINQFVYQASGNNPDALAYINFEEGRIRVMQGITQNNGLDVFIANGNISLPGSKTGAFDYFIMDHQKNVRMVLTEETHVAGNTCTMETERKNTEDRVFGQTGTANEVEATRSPTPTGWQNSSTGGSVSRLGNIAGHNIGPNVLQKVMAGDKVSAMVQYYFNTAPGGSNNNFISSLLGSLASALTAGPGGGIVKENIGAITSQLGGDPAFKGFVQPAASIITAPKAYLTVLFFDERFNFISAADGGALQQQVEASVDAAGAPLIIPNFKAPKNGYVYVYVSNQSDQHVYFDNLNVTIAAGNILEENHYYAYGLKIAAISSRRLADNNEGLTKNLYQYQGSFSDLDEDIGWNDFELRNYDPQIGRWVQQDPYDEFPSPYTGMGNDPVNNIDPSGGGIADGLSTVERLAVSTLGGALIGMAADLSTGGDGFKGAALGAAAGLGVGLGSLGLRLATSVAIQSANTACSILNIPMISAPVGNMDHGPNSNYSNNNYENSDGWLPFYKNDLIRYAQSNGINPTENNLGNLFEDIFEKYATEELFPKEALKLTRFRRADRVWRDAGARNSKPDFVADDFYDASPVFWQTLTKRVFEGSGWEVKQNNGKGIYLSSNDGQIMGHILNLATMHATDIATGNYNPILTLITTYDVNYSKTTLTFATFHRVQYTHSRSKYKIINGQYKFKFVNYADNDW